MKWLLLMVFAYLLGSVPCGVVIARLAGGPDPREAGSGNIGATNVGRTLGRKWGVVTLLADALKGYVPTVLAVSVLHGPWAVVAVGLAAYLGHLYPLFLGLRGGKGVATGLGVFLALAPGSVLWAAVVFGVVLKLGRMVSLASLAAAAALPLATAFFGRPLAVVALAVVVAGFTVARHQANIDRILDGVEPRLGSSAGQGA